MASFARLHRHIDPGSTLGELLFGMIMVMTFTLGTRLLGVDETFNGRELMIAAIGCNIAWGIIDSFLYLLGTAYERRGEAHAQSRPTTGLKPADFRAAFIIFSLVALTALPAALPFLMLDDSYVALRVSNAVMAVLLFVVGYFWGRHVGAGPIASGLLVMSIGIVMVLIAIPLGG